MAHFDVSPLAVFHEKKSSLRVSWEALRLPFLEHKGRKRSCACLPSVARNFLRISQDDCLQHCKLLSADFSPPFHPPQPVRAKEGSFYLSMGFLLSFPVSRLRLSCDAFKNTNHLIILNLIFLVVSSIPRLESVVVVKLQELFAVCLAFNKYELASNQVLRST